MERLRTLRGRPGGIEPETLRGTAGPPSDLRALAEDAALSPQRRAIAVHRLMELGEERPLAIGVRVIEAVAVRYGTRQALGAALLCDRHHRRAALAWAVPVRMADGPGDEQLSRALAEMGSGDALALSLVDEYLSMAGSEAPPSLELLAAWGQHLVTLIEQSQPRVFRVFLRAAQRADRRRLGLVSAGLRAAGRRDERGELLAQMLSDFADLFPDLADDPDGDALAGEPAPSAFEPDFDAALPPESFGNLQAVAEALDELREAGGVENFGVFGWERRPGRYVQVFLPRGGERLRAETPSAEYLDPEERFDDAQLGRLAALGWEAQPGQNYVREWNLAAGHERDLVAAHILQTLRVFGMASEESLTVDLNLQ